MKTCTKCHTEKEDTEFKKWRKVCKECDREYAREYMRNYSKGEKRRAYLKEYRAKEENKDRHYQYLSEWRKTDTCKEYQKKYREENVDKIKEQNQKRLFAYRRRKDVKVRRMELRNRQLSSNPTSRINYRLATAIYQALGKKKSNRAWQSLTGYSARELKEHLEGRFENGMTWDNYGAWHIDHIIPKSHFSYTSHNDDAFKKCWSLDNLQPLWAKENLSKGNRMVG